MSEKHSFQAEIQQLLDIVIHSLYTDKEIFVRELISNAADACEKLRFLQSSGRLAAPPGDELKIRVATDETAGTLTISDNGIGMTRAELVENLGTIAHSGSKAFLQQLAENKKADANLIGQFGVGFYSAFMAGKSVTVYTRSAQPDQPGWKWFSEGTGTYEIEPAEHQERGTKVAVALKEADREFAREHRIEALIKRYSNFVPFPIELNGKVVNTVRALWTRNKNEIKEEEYHEFYHYIGHDLQNPMLRLHFNADAPLAIQALLFVPARNVEALGFARAESEVNLYCRRILIEARAKELFPEWLRFLRGVVDSEDLPLNISRESMQDTALLQKLNQVLTGRFLKHLEEQAEKNPDTYNRFYEQYARFLKEGVATDFAHRESLARLLRFESSKLEAGRHTSLADYVRRMAPEQKEIYHLSAPSREAAGTSPYFEVFRSKGLEVLFLLDPLDEFVMEHLGEFEGKPLKPAEKTDLKVDPPASEESLPPDQAETLARWIKETLGDRVHEVKVSQRLVDSPAVVVDADRMITASMRRMLKGMGKDAPAAQFALEINPRHPMMARLDKTRAADAGLAAKVAEQIFDNARVAAGLMDDPRSMVKRLNELMEQVLAR